MTSVQNAAARLVTGSRRSDRIIRMTPILRQLHWLPVRQLPVISGVPQGTVLGPLLFLLYINDITDNVSSEIRLFTDKCILYRPIISLADQAILQKDINTFYNGSQTWQMCFNAKKCHILNISWKRQTPCLH